MMTSNKKIVSGVFWSFGERIIAQIVSLIVSIILARLLSPKEYSVVAIVMIFITIANVFVSSGFGVALIQKKDADDLDFSTTLLSSLFLSIILYLILFFVAISIARFYENEDLIIIIRIMSLRLIFASINTIQHAFISKQMAFKKFFFSTIIGTIISAIIGIYLAYSGFGVWALIVQYLTNVIIDTIILSITSGFKLKPAFSFGRLKTLFPFGSKVLISDLFSSLYSQLRGLLMSKYYTPNDLSYYNQSDKYSSIFVTNIETSVNKVVFQSTSDAQDNLEDVKSLTRKSINFSFFILSPIQVGLAVTSLIWVPLVLTAKWTPMIPHLMLLCIIYLFNPLIEAHTRVLKSLGKGNILLVVMIVRYVVGIGLLLMALFFFENPLILTFVGIPTKLIALLFCSILSRKFINYSMKEQLSDVIKTILASIIMAISVFFVSKIYLDQLYILIIQILLGIVVYFVVSIIINRKTLYSLIKWTRNLIRIRQKTVE